jgi:adenosine deaminase
MSPLTTKRPLKFYQSIPKVDLHRHLEGSVRLSTLMDIGRSHGITNVGTDYLRSLVQMMETEPYTFENFLSKFVTLREFFCSPEVIRRIAYEAIEDAALDNVRYLELRFTPVALSRTEDYPLGEVMDWVVEAARMADQDNDLITRLIASVNRHESLDVAEQVIQNALDRKDVGIVGLDLAGSEANFSATPFLDIFKEAQQAGMHITVHAGEWGGADNVRQAIEDFGANRIGHGVRVMENPSVVAMAREREAVFEVCVTSNYQSGVVPVLREHPFPKMMSKGLKTTLNTDDPSISQITLGHEYKSICEVLGIPLSKVVGRNLAAVKAAFLPERARMDLFKSMELDLRKYGPVE